MAKTRCFRHLRHEGVRSWMEATEGQHALMFVRAWVRSALGMAGAFRSGAAFPAFSVGFLELTREQVSACFEQLVELGELGEVTGDEASEHDRVFTAAPAAQNARHLGLVLVLTELQKAGKAVTIEGLCTRVHGERAQVLDLLRELYTKNKVRVAGEWVSLAPEREEEPSPIVHVHVVHEGRALCGKWGPPGSWDALDKWVYRDHDGGGPRSAVNCALCKERMIASVAYPGASRCTNPNRDCPRDGDCPEHGKDRPGQCIPTPAANEPPQGDSWRGSLVSMSGGWKGRDV